MSRKEDLSTYFSRHRRDIRSINDRKIALSGEHRLSHEQIRQAFDVAESIRALKDPVKIRESFMGIVSQSHGELISLTKALDKLAEQGIRGYFGYFSGRDRVHKLLKDAANSCAMVTAINCGIYTYISGDKPELDDYFTFDQTAAYNHDEIRGREVKSHCVAPPLGREWISAATQAMLIHNPSIKVRYPQTLKAAVPESDKV